MGKIKASRLKAGDRIRLLGLPGEGQPGYYMHRDTRRVYRKLLARRGPVRINSVDRLGPWIHCQLQQKDGRIEYHWLVIADDDRN